MEAVLKRGDAAPLPWSPRQAARSAVAALQRRIATWYDDFAARPPSSPRELPPEWFRYPLP